MKNKLIAAGIITGTLLSNSSNIFADTLRFPDVPEWAEQSVNYLVDKHAINGLPNGTFGSYETLDRASAAKIITKALGIKINPNEKPSFKDAQNHWGASYIAAAEKAGIVNGVGNGLFNPSGKVTRAEMATMLVNAYKLQSPAKSEKKNIFKDLKGHWGEKYASILIDLGISIGTDNGWQPNRFITRAEAAQLIAKTDTFQNSGGGTLNNTKEISSSLKEGLMDGEVGSIIRDLNEQYVKINYEDKNGEEHSVYVWAVEKHGFKEGDKVKIQDYGKHGKMVYHNGFGYKTTEYDSANSKELLDSKSPITKVNEKQKEEFVIGEIEKMDKYGSDFSNSQQILLEKQYQKETGTVIEKNEDHLTLSKGNLTIKAFVSDNVLKEVNVGDTVNVYAPDFGPSTMINAPLIARNAIIQKIGEKNFLEKQYQKETGTVIEKNEDHLTLSKGNLTIKAFVSDNVLKEVNVGDTVNVYAPDFGPSTMINAPLIARDAIIQKINSQENTSKVNEKQNEDFIIGTVMTSEEYFVTVEYKNTEGKSALVDIDFSKGHNFKQGDKVKVANKSKWEHRKIGLHNVTFASEDSISKVND
ncbi:S-layer homology domain-containing protein [Bacillus thuringiensis]|uniref:S-layer homology domain-containing protein n=1 Tax=Bacillus thuringiensis TaxID=1428 RepID=UPI000E30C3CF|nr:S-layer homology domain-containing protein [Bacillus thuringiensis]